MRREKLLIVIGMLGSFVAGMMTSQLNSGTPPTLLQTLFASSMNEKLIGRLAPISFPDFALHGIKAKVDTGAKTSSLHCTGITLSDDARHVEFHLLDEDHPLYRQNSFRLPVNRIARVKSSNGSVERRVFVMLKVGYDGEVQKSEFSLTDRSDMRYPVLLGRSFLRNGYVVDITR